MVESSLSNWDGSLTPAKASTTPTLSTKPNTSTVKTANLSGEKRIDALQSPKQSPFVDSGSLSTALGAHVSASIPAATTGNKKPNPISFKNTTDINTFNTEGSIVGGTQPQPRRPAKATGARLTAMPDSPFGSPLTPSKPQASERSSQLHFGAPREILTTPASPLAPAPGWLKHTDAVIHMDAAMFLPRPLHRAHTTTPIATGTRTPASSASPSHASIHAHSAPGVLVGSSRAPSTLDGTHASATFAPINQRGFLAAFRGGSATGTNLPADERASSTSASPVAKNRTPSGGLPLFGAPSALLSVGPLAPPRTLGVSPSAPPSAFGAPGALLSASTSASASNLPTSTPMSGASGLAFGVPSTLLAPLTPGRASAAVFTPALGASISERAFSLSPLSSLSGSSPESRGSPASRVVEKTTNVLRKERTSVSSTSKGKSAAIIPSSGSWWDGAYQGRDSSASGRSKKSVNGTNKSTHSERLFIKSPEITKARPPRELFTPPPDDVDLGLLRPEDLFTPPPEGLFTPPPESPFVPERERERGSRPVARKIVRAGTGKSRAHDVAGSMALKPQKRKRELMDYVLVPPLPYKRARLERREGDRRAAASAQAQVRRRKIKLEEEGEVHSSLGDALNQAWSRNERAGTIPVGGVGRDVVRGKRLGERERSRKHDDEEGQRQPSRKTGYVKEVVGGQQQRGKEGRKRAKSASLSGRDEKKGKQMEVLLKRRGSKAPARDHDDNNPVKSVRDKLAEPGTAQEQTRSGAWCREEGDMTRLMFDVPAEDADRAACMGLALALRPGETIPASPTFFRATSIPCLVWPLQADVTQDDELTSGGSVLKRAVPEQGTGRQLPGVGAQGKGKVGEASRGRPAQRKSWQVPIPTPRRRDQQDSSQTLGLSPTPKAKPRTLERAPSQAEADLPSISASPAVLPSPPSAISALPPMEDTISAEGTSPVSHPTSPPPSAIPGPSTSGTPSVPQTADSQLIESAVSVPSSIKVKGKQRALSEVRMRTPSPVQDSGALTWIHRSTSRGRRSASRERTPTLGSPVENSMGQFFHGLDPSPPRPQVSPQGSQYQPLPMPPSPTAMDMHSHLPLLLPIGHPAPSFYQPVDNNQPYGDGTIDPSLLGGGMMEYGTVYGADIDVRMPSPSPGPYSSDDDEAPAPTRSGRRPVKRHIPDDMINTPSDDDYATSSSSGYASDFKPAVKPAPKPAVKSAPKPESKPKPKPKQAANKAKGGQTKRSSVAFK